MEFPEAKGAIVVLGSPNDEQGDLSIIAVERCRQTLAEFERHPDYYILPTGGWGEHFNKAERPHGSYVRKYLASLGIPESAFLRVVESSNTLEDASMAREMIENNQITKLIVVTSDFHGNRAKIIFKREYPGLQIRFSLCRTRLPEEDLSKLRSHEKAAIRKLYTFEGKAEPGNRKH